MNIPLSVRSVMLAMLVLIFAGCTTVQAEKQRPKEKAAETVQNVQSARGDPVGWQYVKFRIRYEKEPFSWRRYMDVAIANEVVIPIVEGHADEIILYRVHRRATPEAPGHQFSLIYYAKRSDSVRIEEEIRSNPFVKQLLAAGELRSVYIPTKTHQDVGATSDKHWPLVLQDVWPFYADGVSNTWLSLVKIYSKQEFAKRDSGQLDLNEKLKLYQKVEVDIDQVWAEWAQHAFIHHLSAIFGYERFFVGF